MACHRLWGRGEGCGGWEPPHWVSLHPPCHLPPGHPLPPGQLLRCQHRLPAASPLPQGCWAGPGADRCLLAHPHPPGHPHPPHALPPACQHRAVGGVGCPYHAACPLAAAGGAGYPARLLGGCSSRGDFRRGADERDQKIRLLGVYRFWGCTNMKLSVSAAPCVSATVWFLGRSVHRAARPPAVMRTADVLYAARARKTKSHETCPRAASPHRSDTVCAADLRACA